MLGMLHIFMKKTHIRSGEWIKFEAESLDMLKDKWFIQCLEKGNYAGNF